MTEKRSVISILAQKEDAFSASQISSGSERRAGRICPAAVGRVRVVLNTEHNGP